MRPTFTHSALRYTFGEMKIERCSSEGKRELAPSTRIQITSSNATSATLAGAVLYAKRSCNPALARGMCACRVFMRWCTRVGARYTVYASRCTIRTYVICGRVYVRDVQLISTYGARTRDAYPCARVFLGTPPPTVYIRDLKI